MGNVINAGDKIEIQELITRFFMAVDADDAQQVAATFVPDGVLVLRQGDETAPFSELIGQKAIEDGSRAFLAQLAERSPNKDRHVLSNFVISPSEQGANVRFFVQNMDVAEGPTILGTAIGDCRAARHDGEWRLQRWDHYMDMAREISGK